MELSPETLQFWNSVQWWGRVVAIVSLVATLAASILSWIAGDRIETIESSITDRQTSALRTTLSQAREEAKKARERADQLEKKKKPRRLTSDQTERLVRLLSKTKGQVDVYSVPGDAEAQDFAIELAQTFLAAGWNTKLSGQFPLGFRGVRLFVKSNREAPPHTLFLQNALQAIGINAPIEEDRAHTLALVVGNNP